MHLINLVETISNAVAIDANLLDWSRGNFNRDPLIYAGIEQADGWPDRDNMPFIVMMTSAKRADQGQTVRTYTIECHLGIFKEGLVEANYKNLTYPKGLKLIGEYCIQLQAAVIAALPNADFQLAITTEIDQTINAPEFHAFMDFDFLERLTLPGDRLA